MAPAPARVLLVGMMGVGKSTVGEALAGRLGWPYHDNDGLVQRAVGRTIPELLEEKGESAIRAAESQALTVALELPPPLVAGIAGGVVLDDRDRDRVRTGGYVVWLRARIDTLVQHVGSGTGRPWLRDDPAPALRALALAREPRYAEVATFTLDVDDMTPEQAADRIVERLCAVSRATPPARSAQEPRRQIE